MKMKLTDDQIIDISNELANQIYFKFDELIKKRDNNERIKIDKEILQQILLHFTYNHSQYLSLIDLSEVSFDKINVEEVDFSNTNANIDPQTVLFKSLNGTNLYGIDMSGKDFTNVDIERANLSNTNANIDPQTVLFKSLRETYLYGIDMSGKDFTNVDIVAADLSNTNANIDPQTVKNKDLTDSVLYGLDLSDKNFENTILNGTYLENTGARIYPKKIREYIGANLIGCKVILEDEEDLDYLYLFKFDSFEIMNVATISKRAYNLNSESTKKYIKSLFKK